MAHFRLSRLLSLSPRLLRVGPTLLIVALTLAVAGCHPAAPPAPPAVTDPKDPKFIVAEKGDYHVTRADLNAQIDTYLKEHQATADQVGAKMPLLETAMLDNMILKKLLLDKAAAMPIKDIDQQVTAELDALKARMPPGQNFDDQLKKAGLTLDDLKTQIHDKILIDEVMKAEALQNVEPTDQEINDLYVKNKDHFNIPPKVRASRILVMVKDKATPAEKAAAKKQIDLAHARVAKGEDFSKVATEVSQDRYSAPRGGDIGFFQRNENEAQFDDVAFASKVGVLSPVFETPMGYQFLKVTATQPGGVVPVSDARDYISKRLRQGKVMEAEEAYTKKLLADSGVTYHIARVVPPPMPAPGANPPPQGAPPAASENGSTPASAAPNAPATNAPAEVTTAPMPAPDTNAPTAAPK